MVVLHTSIITLFPEMFPGSLQYSLAGQALRKGIWSYETINLRDFGISKHKNVDDVAYGGGHGLIMRADVLGASIDQAMSKYPDSKVYYPSPRGKLLNHGLIQEIINEKEIIILCGRFEGIDERVIEEYNVREISIGDYVLSGGELAALVILDCMVRLLPGVVENQATLQSESFEPSGEFNGLLECPLYTRPFEWRGRCVPEVLVSGHHERLREWKKEQSTLITSKRRPDLLKNK
ncbi:tRNA (guanosine(37)-N1)-methyltransferase TrmD [Candidatus Trichorickettsia mobilis]|uniref:tRNA (guanosine(37)-N1)-methyltransferase TrmD n=1 Tax=Candidatus Trichorickettsia mobilis TaxID=1346319 RepID=UPI0029310B00|nr:tRNA (guanosine(37)-N1)-methyltransferase TrmD [Candidatus Trichorickettsia mobilis]